MNKTWFWRWVSIAVSVRCYLFCEEYLFSTVEFICVKQGFILSAILRTLTKLITMSSYEETSLWNWSFTENEDGRMKRSVQEITKGIQLTLTSFIHHTSGQCYQLNPQTNSSKH